MRKGIMIALVALMISVQLFADEVKTLGDGTIWTMSKLALTEGSGVSKNGTTFTMNNTVVVAEGDSFEMEGGITVQLAADVSLEIEGDAMMAPNERSTFTSVGSDTPGVVYLRGCNDVVLVKSLDFEYVGLKYFATKGMNVDDCSFYYIGNRAALNIGGEGAEFIVTNSTFGENGGPAIAGAANYSNPITIDDCEFLYNGMNNPNNPQLNLTSASDVVVRNCIIIGERNNTNVGGIVVSDLYGVANNAHTLIEDNEIRDNRFGLSLYNNQTAVVRNNTILNNNTDVPETDEDYNPGRNTFYNNGCYGEIYDLYNNSANTVYAQNNYWKTATTQDAEGIENCISHKVDNPTLGEVIFTPFATEDLTAIDEAKATTPQTEAIYSLSGVKLTGLQKGLNIVRDGNKTIKVFGK